MQHPEFRRPQRTPFGPVELTQKERSKMGVRLFASRNRQLDRPCSLAISGSQRRLQIFDCCPVPRVTHNPAESKDQLVGHSVVPCDEIAGGYPAKVRLDEGRLRDLMVLYQQADSAAVEELVVSLSPMLLRFFAVPMVSQSDAEDMLQDCWVRIHRARHTYRPADPLLPWIFAVARHTRLDAYRRRRRLVLRETLMAETPEPPAPYFSRDRNVRAGDVFAMVNRLPDTQRDVIVMLKVAGMSLEEVARATSSTTGAIKQKAHRAYQSLRRMIEEKP
jgi:RNA polymerase sigma-70 factor, ECF subfamily